MNNTNNNITTLNTLNEDISLKFYLHINDDKTRNKIRTSKYKKFSTYLNKLMDVEYDIVLHKLYEKIRFEGWNKSTCKEDDFYNYFHSCFKNHCLNYVKKKEVRVSQQIDNIESVINIEDESDSLYKEQLDVLEKELVNLVNSNKLNMFDLKYLKYYVQYTFRNTKITDISKFEKVKITFIKEKFSLIEEKIKELIKR